VIANVRLERFTQRQFVSLAIEQVDDQLLLVRSEFVLKVQAESLDLLCSSLPSQSTSDRAIERMNPSANRSYGFQSRMRDHGSGIVLERRRSLAPEERYASACLHERRPMSIHAEDLLGFDVVGNRAVLVDSARQVARSGTTGTASRDQDKVERQSLHHEDRDLHVCVVAASDIRCCLRIAAGARAGRDRSPYILEAQAESTH